MGKAAGWQLLVPRPPPPVGKVGSAPWPLRRLPTAALTRLEPLDGLVDEVHDVVGPQEPRPLPRLLYDLPLQLLQRFLSARGPFSRPTIGGGFCQNPPL